MIDVLESRSCEEFVDRTERQYVIDGGRKRRESAETKGQSAWFRLIGTLPMSQHTLSNGKHRGRVVDVNVRRQLPKVMEDPWGSFQSEMLLGESNVDEVKEELQLEWRASGDGHIIVIGARDVGCWACWKIVVTRGQSSYKTPIRVWRESLPYLQQLASPLSRITIVHLLRVCLSTGSDPLTVIHVH